PGPYVVAPYGPYGYYMPYNYYYMPYGYYTPYGRYVRPTYIQPQYSGTFPLDKAKLDKVPELVLYVATGDGIGPGKVYQVKGEDGQVMGKQNIEKTPTGIDMYRDH